MKTVEEIKEARKKILFTEAFGISVDELVAKAGEIREIIAEFYESNRRPTIVELVIKLLDDVLELKNYTPEQVLRGALFMNLLFTYYDFEFVRTITEAYRRIRTEETLRRASKNSSEGSIEGPPVEKPFCPHCGDSPEFLGYREDGSWFSRSAKLYRLNRCRVCGNVFYEEVKGP